MLVGDICFGFVLLCCFGFLGFAANEIGNRWG